MLYRPPKKRRKRTAPSASASACAAPEEEGYDEEEEEEYEEGAAEKPKPSRAGKCRRAREPLIDGRPIMELALSRTDPGGACVVVGLLFVLVCVWAGRVWGG